MRLNFKVLLIATTLITTVSKAQNFSKAFGKIDKNHDGGISKDEAASRKGFANTFDKVDTDVDGTVSLEEFTAAVSKGRGNKGKGK